MRTPSSPPSTDGRARVNARRDPNRVHVERTASPTVLRWVCRRPDLDHTPVPPTGGRFDRLFADGTVVSVDVARGDLLVAFGSPAAVADRAVVARVHDAVVEALGSPEWRAGGAEAGVEIRRRATMGP